MAKTTAPLLPKTHALLLDFGARLKLARLRRKLTAKQVAQRAGMSPMTLRSLEAGGAGVTMGAYLSVMQVLGLEKELDKLAAEDLLGRHLQDSRLMQTDRPARPTAPVDPARRTRPAATPYEVAPIRGPDLVQERAADPLEGTAYGADAPSKRAEAKSAQELAKLLKPMKRNRNPPDPS